MEEKIDWFTLLNWWKLLEPKEKTRLGLKYRNTLAYGVFSNDTIRDIYNKELFLKLKSVTL